MPPKAFFCHRCFVQLDKSVQKLHKCMKKKFTLGNCYLNNQKWVWNIWPQWPWPLTQWHQHRYDSSATQDRCLDQVWGRLVKAFSCYWFETVLTHLTQISIGFLCYPGWMCVAGMRKEGQGILELLIGNGCDTFDSTDLDLWPSDLQIWQEFIWYQGWMCDQSLKNVGQSLIDQKRKGYRQTNMCKAIYPLFFEGGHRNIILKPSINFSTFPK